MHKLRAVSFIIIRFLFDVMSGVVPAMDEALKTNARSKKTKKSLQQLVESVDIQGNRRLRDEDLLYYIRTRPGDIYDPAQLERDLRELLSLNFFDKTETRVLPNTGFAAA